MGEVKRKNAILSEISETLGQVPGWVRATPDAALEGFWTLFRDFQLSETAIPNKYKELIGLAVSGATRCKYCVLFHTEAAKLNGATEEEIAEAAMMGGVTMMASTFVNALGTDFEAFERETREIVDYVKLQASRKAPTSKSPPRAHV